MYKIPSCGFDQMDNDKFEVIFPIEDEYSQAELSEHYKDTQAIVSVFGHKITKEFIDLFPSLKLISNFGVGYDNVDIAYASERNIVVTNTPDPVCEPTAELAMGLMIALSRKIGWLNNQLRSPEGIKTGVMRNLSSTLYGKTLGIIGMGSIGKTLARRALAFGMKIIYHNRKPMDQETEELYNTHWVDMDTLLQDSDVISLHVPLTKETQHIINTSSFDKMKNTAFLINTARGSVINQDDLIVALKESKIAGAGLDVYENEPHIPDELKELPNTVLTPHVGTATKETREEMSVFVSNIIVRFFNNNLDQYIVN